MPQGRKKVPFSGKAKKDQLKAKKQSKNQPFQRQGGRKAFVSRNTDDDDDDETHESKKLNQQPGRSGRSNTNRYALQFYCDTPEEVKLKKQQASEEIVPVDEKQLELLSDDYYTKDMDFPKRPEWSYNISRESLEAREQRYFTEYVNELERKIDRKKLSYFELNLETWRQLWRVLEMSDIVLLIVDIRYPVFMFPPSLYDYVTNVLHRDMILVINKIDLAPAPLVVAWKHYFQEKYPRLNIVLFTSMPGYNLRGNQNQKSGLKIRRRRGRLRMAAEGAQLLFEACRSIVGDEVDLNSWKRKLEEEMSIEYDDEDEPIEIEEKINLEKVDTTYFQHEKYKNNVLTIGCLGQPNVGKSSLMNALMGKKVVSVSRTPGHTKHFQTIFLTQHVRLCDCPGLVFPSQVPKPIQVLLGSYPIAQLREPYSAMRFLAERIDLIKLLKLTHPTDDDTWSTIDICDGWAKQRGFFTAKAARLDTYRAANHILRMALDGKICLCLYPPGYNEKKDEWLTHPDVKTVEWIQAIPEQDTDSGWNYKAELLDDSEDESNPNQSGNDDDDSDKQKNNDDDDDTESDTPVTTNVNKFSLLCDE